MIVGGKIFLRKISECSGYRLMLGGQISECLDAMKNFVAASQLMQDRHWERSRFLKACLHGVG
jgi:hypothetical protein